MTVFNDMANDAGCRYGTPENQQMAQMIEYLEFERCVSGYEKDMMLAIMRLECRYLWE